MSKDWFDDVEAMHLDKGHTGRFVSMDDETRLQMLSFRHKFLEEEFNELDDSIVSGDAEGVVDALIDLIVVAAGTLDAFGVDGHKAWDEVHRANMRKVPGVKPERPNPLGLPDMIKPEGWEPPDHEGNTGTLVDTLTGDRSHRLNVLWGVSDV